MDIQVGDRVTTKQDNKSYVEIIIGENDAERIIESIQKNRLELIKIERPKWEVVEEKKELLTEEERDLLKNYMKLIDFENDIEYIEKMDNHIIVLYLQDKCDFRFETTIENFVNLENYKKYTLSELGLEE